MKKILMSLMVGAMILSTGVVSVMAETAANPPVTAKHVNKKSVKHTAKKLQADVANTGAKASQ